jgi:hypothetical protein
MRTVLVRYIENVTGVIMIRRATARCVAADTVLAHARGTVARRIGTIEHGWVAERSDKCIDSAEPAARKGGRLPFAAAAQCQPASEWVVRSLNNFIAFTIDSQTRRGHRGRARGGCGVCVCVCVWGGGGGGQSQ